MFLDRCLSSRVPSKISGVEQDRLLSDTKLVVLHYISGSCSSTSNTPSPAVSILPSPYDR